MDIFRSRFYRISVSLLSFVGLWPYTTPKSWPMYRRIMIQTIMLTCFLTMSIGFIEIWGDFDTMIECITPMGIELLAIIKFYNSWFHQKNVMILLEKIKNDWSGLRNKTEVEILGKYAQHGRNLTIIYAVCVYFGLVMYLMIPSMPRILDVIVPLNESRPSVYLYQTEYYVDPEEYFIWILLHTYASTILTITIIAAVDTLFFCYVMHICGILAVVGHRIENLTSKSYNSDVGVYVMSQDEDDRCYREIILCINQHYKITEVTNVIESTNSISYLLILTIAIIILSMSGVQLLIKFGQVDEMFRLFIFSAGQCTHLLFNSWPCQKLIDECDKFRESLYASEWYSLSEANKNLLKFVMLRSLKPQQITAGKLYVMSLENFGVVLQTSVSYFTVFASVR